jgi:hypothetical protein
MHIVIVVDVARTMETAAQMHFAWTSCVSLQMELWYINFFWSINHNVKIEEAKFLEILKQPSSNATVEEESSNK